MNAVAIFRANAVPVMVNRTYATRAEAVRCPVGDLRLVQDGATGLVHNAAFDARLISYDASYQNEQGLSPAFRQHLTDVMAIIQRHMAARRIVEIGCGKGFFLDLLRSAGFDAAGMDPAYDGDSVHVQRREFAASMRIDADALILRHVLEHVPEPRQFLANAARAIGGKGRIYIEVPCFDWILRERAWFDCVYEHVNYFRRSDFESMFGEIHEIGHVFGGQYLYVIAELGSLRADGTGVAQPAVLEVPHAFANGQSAMAKLVLPKGHFAIWGAGAKGAMYAHYLARAGIAVELVVDINPAKQGRYLPASGSPVVSPEHALAKLRAGALIVVANPNYLAEIVERGGNRFRYTSIDHPVERPD